MSRWRKRPAEVDACRIGWGWPDAIWDGVNRNMIVLHLNSERVGERKVTTGHVIVHTLHGPVRAEVGDWIIRGETGDFWPCKHEIFLRTYEVAQ